MTYVEITQSRVGRTGQQDNISCQKGAKQRRDFQANNRRVWSIKTSVLQVHPTGSEGQAQVAYSRPERSFYSKASSRFAPSVASIYPWYWGVYRQCSHPGTGSLSQKKGAWLIRIALKRFSCPMNLIALVIKKYLMLTIYLCLKRNGH